MNSPILTDTSTQSLKYAVKVNGKIVSPKYTTPQGAESALSHLTEEHKAIAEIVQVTDDGSQLLLG